MRSHEDENIANCFYAVQVLYNSQASDIVITEKPEVPLGYILINPDDRFNK